MIDWDDQFQCHDFPFGHGGASLLIAAPSPGERRKLFRDALRLRSLPANGRHVGFRAAAGDDTNPCPSAERCRLSALNAQQIRDVIELLEEYGGG